MISIVLAAHNAAPTIGITLDAFCALEPPESGYEIIVVDNNSSDNTSEIAKSYEARLPITVLWEARQGKNRAVNRGIEAAAGDLILLTDDDVIPDPSWLKVYEAGAKKYPDCSVFAGQVRHHWQKKPPTWLTKLAEKGNAYAGTPINMPEGDIAPQLVKGPNFLLRKTVFAEHSLGGSIGPDGSRNYAAGSETEYLIRLSAAGYRMIYIPDAVVKHIVRPYQISLRAVLARYFRIGRGIQATGAASISGEPSTLFGYPRFMFRVVLTDALAAVGPALRGDSSGAVHQLMDAAISLGRAYEWRRRRRLDAAKTNVARS